MIGRYSSLSRAMGTVSRCRRFPGARRKVLSGEDFTDLQVLSQIAWFDEFFLEEPDFATNSRSRLND